MQYVAEEKLSLEETISKYVSKTFPTPKFHEEEIKLIDLAMHGSSIPSLPTIPMKLYEASELDIENYFRKFKLPRAPGTKYEDSDLGYSLMSHILSRLEKTSYKNILFEKVLKPLEMNETYYSIPLMKMNHFATGYKGIAEVRDHFIDREGSFFKPCRGLISSIDNLSKWLAFLLKETKTPLDEGLKLLYSTIYTFPDLLLKKRVPGLSVEPLSFKTSLLTYREGGIYQGFSYSIAFIPTTKTGVVILSNTEYEVEKLATTILELLNQ
jgi:CubicO group peptidase (beta-lactamase class C family)